MQRRFQKYMLVALVFVIVSTLGSAITAVAQDALESGKELYQQRCSPCHGPDGKANTPTAKALTPKPRDHTNGKYMNALSNEHLIKVIQQGGASVGKSPIMPPQADLKKEQIENVIVFVRSLADPPYEEN